MAERKTSRAAQLGATVGQVAGQGWDQATAAIGSALRTVFPGASVPISAALPFIVSQSGREAVRDFTQGVSGQPVGAPSQAVTRKAAPAPVKAAARPAGAPKQEKLVVTPEDRANAMLSTMLGSPLTVGQFEHVAQTMPTIASVQSKAASPKNVALGQAAAVSQSMFANEVAQAQALAETDPEAARGAVAKATDAFYQRQSSLGGVNMQQMAQAQMLAAAQAAREED